jgi:hypothetical protein
LQLIGVLLADRLRDLRLLARRKRRLLAAAPPALTGRQCPLTAATMRPHPVTDGLARDPQQPSDLDLRPTTAHERHGTPTKLFLGGLGKRSSVTVTHTTNTTTNANYLPARSSNATGSSSRSVIGRAQHPKEGQHR